MPNIRTDFYRFSSRKMTVLVGARGNKITSGAPVIRRFIGQPLDNLRAWMRKQGEFQESKLES